MSDIKLKFIAKDPGVRLHTTIRQSINQDVQAYAAFYEHVHGVKAELADLIGSMLSGFMAEDKGFAKFKKSAPSAKLPTPPVTVAVKAEPAAQPEAAVVEDSESFYR